MTFAQETRTWAPAVTLSSVMRVGRLADMDTPHTMEWMLRQREFRDRRLGCDQCASKKGRWIFPPPPEAERQLVVVLCGACNREWRKRGGPTGYPIPKRKQPVARGWVAKSLARKRELREAQRDGCSVPDGEPESESS